MPSEDTQWKPGQSGNPSGPKPGVPALQKAMRKLFEQSADEFAAVFDGMLREGDSTAWQLMMKRAMPEPKAELDVTSDGGPVSFSWKQPAKKVSSRKKATSKKAPRRKKTDG
jgi:hypothetical protein